MNIKQAVYEGLSAEERVKATLEAMARGDDEEKRRLIRTCPKRSYTMSDHRYAHAMVALGEAALAVECDMRGCALNFLMIYSIGENCDEKAHLALHEKMSKTPCHIVEMVSIYRAWELFLEGQGIAPELVRKSHGEARSAVVSFLLRYAEAEDIKPDETIIERYKDVIEGYMTQAVS